MSEENTVEKIKCVIIGSGPAGYTAAIYAARSEFKACSVYRFANGRSVNYDN